MRNFNNAQKNVFKTFFLSMLSRCAKVLEGRQKLPFKDRRDRFGNLIKV